MEQHSATASPARLIPIPAFLFLFLAIFPGLTQTAWASTAQIAQLKQIPVVAPVVEAAQAAVTAVQEVTQPEPAVALEQPTPFAESNIPPEYLVLYQQAAANACPEHLPWTVLAGIGSRESDHGRHQGDGVQSGSNAYGASGVMQIGTRADLPAGDQWAVVGADGDGDGVKDVHNPADAIPGAVNHLRRGGVCEGQLGQAIWNYNHACWYIHKVVSRAREYGLPSDHVVSFTGKCPGRQF
ncbi:lytic transglycosylase domain-containing protein [Candidatus Parcubacteria bacterium]|nr:lytic transglycosylase domain-containing protein [Candidatus Parcubacteria bacterium]